MIPERIYFSKKVVASSDYAMEDPEIGVRPNTQTFNSRICAPDKHRWRNRKHIRICVRCGLEQLK